MTDTDALTERLYQEAFEDRYPGYSWESALEYVKEAHRAKYAAFLLPIVAAEVRKAKAGVLTKRWVCQVARSGYHNGASCRPDDAHNDWGCDYYYEASIRATEYETGDRT